MRLAAILLLALFSACAGPRLATPTSTAQLPPPRIRRAPSLPPAAPPVAPPVVDVRIEPVEVLCDT